MPRIQPLDYQKATGEAKQLMEKVQSDWGLLPNAIRTLAHSPAALRGYLDLMRSLGGGVLPATLREQIAVTVAEANGCDYCVAAHYAIGKSVGLSEDTLTDSRRGTSTDSKEDVALRFARRLVENSARVTDDDVARLRRGGYGDREIVEIVANVALNIFTNYFNHVARTDVDFPAVPELSHR
jgi:uncharacterized peroxidase-related enzyme